MQTMSKSVDELNHGVVLAELGGYGNGPYCAKYGAGAALVMMGTYIVDPGDDVPYSPEFVFKPDRSTYFPYLQKHVAAARKSGGSVGVSVISVRVSHTVDFLAAAQEAGADYASLCVHSSMDMFVSAGVGEALCDRANSDELKEWAKAILNAVAIPVIFKMRLRDPEDMIAVLDTLAGAGIPAVHINAKQALAGAGGPEQIKQLAGRCRCLIVGGGISDIKGARQVIECGANAVGIGAAAMKDAALCGRIQNLLRKETREGGPA